MKKPSRRVIGTGVLILAVTWVAFLAMTMPRKVTRTDPAIRDETSIQRISPSQIRELESYVSELTDAGVLTSVDVSPIYTYVSVGRLYWELTYKQKTGLAIIMSRYSASHGGSVHVAFKDGYTDKKIATYVSGVFSLVR